jgi:RHS repeat-associated protein
MNANDRNTTCEKSNIDLPADWSDLPNLQKAYVLSLDARVPDKLYYFHADHLGGGSIITDETSKTYQTLAYAPYGESLINVRNGNDYDERHQFTGYEKDEETGLSQAKNRYYDSKLSIFYSVDALAEKFPNIAGYAYCSNNPINFIDPDGREPIKPYAGTVGCFVRFMNGLSTGIGSATGATAHAAMLRMGMTNGIKPANTAPFNTSGNNRYIYTEKGGWVDMAHFMFYAGRAYNYKQQKQQAQEFVNSKGFAFMSPESQMYWIKQAGMNPVGEAVQDGYLQEFGDKFTAPHSAYSYEDLPSDKFGADFGANYFDPNSKQTFSEQIQNYLNGVPKATDPQNAPNYNSLPNDYPDKPTRTNKTTTPVYTKDNP